MGNLLSIPEVARLAGESERLVREAIHQAVLRGQKVGAAWAIYREDAEAWAGAQRDLQKARKKGRTPQQ